MKLETGPNRYMIRGKGWGYIPPRFGTLSREKKKVECRKRAKYEARLPEEPPSMLQCPKPNKKPSRHELNFFLRRTAGASDTGGYIPGPKSFRSSPKFGNISKRAARRATFHAGDAKHQRETRTGDHRPHKTMWTCSSPPDPLRNSKREKHQISKIERSECDGNPNIVSIIKKPKVISTPKNVHFEFDVYVRACIWGRWKRMIIRYVCRPVCRCLLRSMTTDDHKIFGCIYCLQDPRAEWDSESGDNSIPELVAGGTEPDTSHIDCDQFRSHITLTASHVLRIASSRTQARLLKRARIEMNNPSLRRPKKNNGYMKNDWMHWSDVVNG